MYKLRNFVHKTNQHVLYHFTTSSKKLRPSHLSILDSRIKPIQPTLEFDRETSHFICSVKCEMQHLDEMSHLSILGMSN